MAKFKLEFSDGTNTKTITENHPKLTATDVDFRKAGAAGSKMYNGYQLVKVDLNSDTTVFTAD